MIGSIIRKLYTWIPNGTQKILGKSEILRPIRNLILRPQGVFRETSIWVKRSYIEYSVSFKFYASLKVASKAKKSGIENTLLRNAITLVRKHKGLSNKAVIFDVGANFGYLSLVWAKSIAQNGRVIAFEPNLIVQNSFKKSIQANNLESVVELRNLAVGKKDGTIEIFLSSTTSNTLRENIETNNSNIIEMVTLDSFAKRNEIERCDLVKIDVDGIELDILKGGIQLIEKYKPIFIVETNGNAQILDFFRNIEYQILNMQLKPFQPGNKLPANIFCVPNF